MEHWLNEATVTDYKSVKAFFERARFPDKGKPLRSWARIHKDGDDYVVKTWNTTLCRFKPNNTVEFTATPEEVWHNSCTLTGSMHRAIPFATLRIAKGRYRLAHVREIDANKTEYPDHQGFYNWWDWLKKEAPEYFQGITFDLATHKCLNRRPDDKLIAIPEKRKVWLRALREFKKGIKVRAKMNVFEGISDSIEQGDNLRFTPDWSHGDYKELLFTSIRDGEFPQELLTGINRTYRSEYSWNWSRPSPKDIITITDKICNTYSVELRRQFGVFKKSELHS